MARKKKASGKPRKKSRIGGTAQLKRLILRLIKKFEEDIKHPDGFSEFWGEKESPATVITKLSQILLKLFAVADPKGPKKRSGEEVTEEDFAILRYCLENRKPENNPAGADADISAAP